MLIFVHLRNQIYVKQIELLIICLDPEGRILDDITVILKYFWQKNIARNEDIIKSLCMYIGFVQKTVIFSKHFDTVLNWGN